MRDQQVNQLPPKHFQLLTLGQISLRGPSGDDAELARRRRKVVLLAVLALSRRPPSRASLTEMFWGNLSEERARHSLSDALSHLRRVLGRDAIAIRSDVVDLETSGRLAVDVIEFEAACEARDFGRAIDLYAGPFLGDFHVERSSSFDDWVSRARDRYARLFAHACESQCALLLRAGRAAESASCAARWLELDMLSAPAMSALLHAASASDDVGTERNALAEYERWSSRRTRDLDALPDPRLAALADALAQRVHHAPLPQQRTPVISEVIPAPAAVDVQVIAPPTAPAFIRRTRWIWAAVAATGAATFVALGVTRAGANGLPLKPVIALVDVQTDRTDTSLAWLGEGLKQMIAADLARVPTADVIPPIVLRGAADRAGLTHTLSADQRVELARRVHATLAVSATVTRNEGSYVVSVLSQSVSGPHTVQRFSATGTDVVLLADEVAAHVLSVAGIGTQGPRLSDVETSNTEAYRHFVLGQQDLDDGRINEANNEFDRAIAADSGFTSAIVARLHGSGAAYVRFRPLLDRVRPRLTEWDRMSEAVHDAYRDGDHTRAEALAQELEARFPQDPRAIDTEADIYYMHGRFRDAEAAYLRELALDSLALMAGHGPCAPCSAIYGLTSARRALGDTAGARRAAERLVELVPGSPGAWTYYGNTLLLAGAHDRAIVALRRAHELLGDSSFDENTARALITARRYDEAEAMARPFLRAPSPEARDIQSTVDRERGRYRASIAALEAGPGAGGFDLVVANSFAAVGDSSDARRVYRRKYFDPSRISSGGALIGALRGDEARAFAWDHANEADALWDRLDTTFLRITADSIQTIGARSYYARDWQLHHHIRGLIALRAGRLDDAERDLSAAMASFPGWTRTNLMLARVRLAQSHPAAALETLRRAYLEPLDAMGRYVPRTELDFEMARAFTALGQLDSARVYAGYVRRAWATADPEIKARLTALRCQRGRRQLAAVILGIMKKIGFLSFGHWSASSHSAVRSARDVLQQSIELSVAAEELGADGAYFRVHHYAQQLSSPFPLLAAVGARTSRIEIGTGVIDMRYENPHYMVENAGAADLISNGRLQLGISRGSPEQVIEGWRYFGYAPPEGGTDADLGRRHAEVFLELLKGEGFAKPNPRPMFPNPPGLLRLEPHSKGLRDRIWWGSASNATATWAAKMGMNLQSSTLKEDESGEPFHVQQARQIRVFRQAWADAGHTREPRVSVSRSIFALMDDRDRAYFGHDRSSDQIGVIDNMRAVFGRSYAAEPDELIEELKEDEAIAEADTLLLTVPNTLGVDYNAHVIESILTHVAPALGWR